MDTQTGLRGYRADMLPWLMTVRGQRYEYELNLLLEAKQAGYGIDSVEIATVYLDHNSGSHFRPVADSLRIYAPLLKFLGSSLSAFVVDLVMFLLLSALTDSLLLAVVGARLVSATVNFMVNRRLVFEHGRDTSLRAAATGYVALVLVLLSANYAAMWTLTSLAIPDLLAKLVTEMTLLGISYAVQQRFLFARKAPAAVETHIPALVRAQFQHSLAGKSGHQSPKRFRSNR
ncbi:GtrA family protein [Arthrobacter sp. 9V]|uniref:GtrA family protein n=1 Tax=Arthrobacter sp. 9V TaxID=2653132 RepID=UPI001F1F6409|nr:GtrA family protein [Arthrobacter sp. 9V]